MYLVVDTSDHFYNNPYLVTDSYDEAIERADYEHVAVIEIRVGHYGIIYEWPEEEQEYYEEEEETPEEECVDENEEYESEDEASESITYIAEVFEAS